MKTLRFAVVVFVFSALAFAKDTPKQVLNWPTDEKPMLRFSVYKIREISSYKGQNSYTLDTTVDNLSTTTVTKAEFTLYFFDKKNIRIGDGRIQIENVHPGESIKVSVDAFTAGPPNSISVTAKEVPQEWAALAPVHKVSLTVYSVPTGAVLKIDGKEVGVTPLALNIAVGGHQLEFSKEGYTPGIFPMAVTQDQLSGGSVTYELGSSGHDSIELRDGSVLSADVESVNATEVVVKMGGSVQTFNRNQIKRIGFTVRQQ